MKNYLIIGASSGIGQRLAQILSVDGNTIFGTYFNHPIEKSDDHSTFHSLNVLDDAPELSFLPDVVDGLVYCPGTINLKPFGRLKPASFTEDFNLQVVGAIKIIQQVLPKMKKSEHGAIVLFSTVAVQQGFNFHTQVATSKGAIEGLTRSLAAELAPTISVNAIAPSLTDTPLASQLLSSDEKRKSNAMRHPLQRIGTPTDIAEMAAFLLSEKASWISGQIFKVDGGMSAIR